MSDILTDIRVIRTTPSVFDAISEAYRTGVTVTRKNNYIAAVVRKALCDRDPLTDEGILKEFVYILDQKIAT
jgi:hypothetical protein